MRLGVVALAACAAEAPVLDQVTVAGTPVELAVPSEPSTGEDGAFRWELLDTPGASRVRAPIDTDARARFTPDVRGAYLLARWRAGVVGEDLTHYFAITATPIPPIARIRAPLATTAGSAVMIDARTSESPEGLPLRVAWRLAGRPAGSAATLPGDDAVDVTLRTDTPGAYVIELGVFDGELWNAAPEVHTLVASPVAR